MGHIELREIEDGDLDSVYDMLQDSASIALAPSRAFHPRDRADFDEWVRRQRESADANVWVVTEAGTVVGTAVATTQEGNREITCRFTRKAREHETDTEALRLLITREAPRPLYVPIASEHTASLALLTKLGFIEVSRSPASAPDGEELLLALPPTLE